MNPYFQLARYILPAELLTSFDLCDVEELGSELHLYLEEKGEAHLLPQRQEQWMEATTHYRHFFGFQKSVSNLRYEMDY